mmetsp:Transcript_21399/g.66397  ORF Transcript_21399/g.66397 Transcript_21399/m.66397 type:complete len:268 (-) Transcript_21399:333-1136(-)
MPAQRERRTAQRELQVGQFGHALTVDHVLARAEDRHRTCSLGDRRDRLARPGEHGCARVEDRVRQVGRRHVTKRDRVERGLPVGVGGDGHVVERARVVRRVHAAERQLTRRIVPQVKGEHGRAELPLRDERLDDGRDAVDGDGREGHAEDAVEAANAVRQPEPSDCVHLRELLVLRLQTRDRDRVVRKVARDRPRAVHDGKLGAVLGVALRARGGVLRLEQARKPALRVRHPQVGRTRVEDHLERLWRRAEPDRAVVLRVLVVGDDD